MGWTGTYNYDKAPKGKERIAAAIKQEGLEYERPEYGIKSTVIDSALVGNTVYCAVHYVNVDNGANEIYASVILTEYRNGEFLTKEMSEMVGPYCYDCPKHILDKLSETTSENAKEWRKACAEKREKKNADKLGKLNFGAKIKLTAGTHEGEILTAYQHKSRKVFLNMATNIYFTQQQVRNIGYTLA